jgi:hypothetical protein
MEADANTAKLTRLEKKAKGAACTKKLGTRPEIQSRKNNKQIRKQHEWRAVPNMRRFRNFGLLAQMTDALLRTIRRGSTWSHDNGNAGGAEAMAMHGQSRSFTEPWRRPATSVSKIKALSVCRPWVREARLWPAQQA